MQIQVFYQGLDASPWTDQFIAKKIAKLERYLGPSSAVQVNVRMENSRYFTNLIVHNLSSKFVFVAEGQNLFESFSEAHEKATRSLGEHKRKLKDKINRKFFSLKRSYA
jgi:ribosomal subunit interface protein